MQPHAGRLRIEWSWPARAELKRLRPFDRIPIQRAVLELENQALVETTNRTPLRAPLQGAPDATWQVRVNRWRVMYRVQDGTVRILRVILKDGTTAESL